MPPRRRLRILQLTGVMTVMTSMLAAGGAGTVTALAAPSAGRPPQPAQLTAASGTVRAGHMAKFTASRPAGVSAYSWTLTGPGVIGGQFSATCSASTSQLETSFTKAGVVNVTVNIQTASGTVSTTRKVVVKTAKVRPIAAAVKNQATQWVLCARGPADPAVQPVSNGGPPIGCQYQYIDGPIQAIGCFTVLPEYGK